MNRHEEAGASALRGGLDVDLGGLEPGPPPIDAVIVRGRAIRRTRRRTRATVAAAVALVAVLSGLLLPSAWHRSPGAPPAAPTSKDWISVNSPAYDEEHGYAGSGTVRGRAWYFTMDSTRVEASDGNSRSELQAVHTLLLDGVKQGVGMPGPKGGNPLSALNWVGSNVNGFPDSSTVYAGYGLVPDGTGAVVAHFTDGASVTYPAVEVAGRRYVVVLATASPMLDRLTAYRTDGSEMGYEQPVALRYQSPETPTATWYAPNQAPAVQAAELTFSGTIAGASGSPWEIDVQAGGLTICSYTPVGQKFGGVMCDPVDPATESRTLHYTVLSVGDPVVLTVGPLKAAVTKVVATLVGGQQVTLPFQRIDGWGMCADVFAAGGHVVGLTAYDASGKALEHTGVPG